MGDLEPMRLDHADERMVYFVATIIVIVVAVAFGALGYSAGRLDRTPDLLDCFPTSGAPSK